MVYSRFFYDIIVTNPSWYPPNPWRRMVYSRFFIWYHKFSWWHHTFRRWHHTFRRWHSMQHTMQCSDQFYRYLIPCLCWGSARTPLLPWCWPVHCPAAPEPPASLAVSVFGSTIVHSLWWREHIMVHTMWWREHITNILYLVSAAASGAAPKCQILKNHKILKNLKLSECLIIKN